MLINKTQTNIPFVNLFAQAWFLRGDSPDVLFCKLPELSRPKEYNAIYLSHDSQTAPLYRAELTWVEHDAQVTPVEVTNVIVEYEEAQP